MRHFGIEQQTLWITLAPVLVMAILLDSFFITTRFADLERTLIERSQLLTRQLASSSEYPVFSGNAILLKQNVDAVMSFQDVVSIRIFDDKSRQLLEAGSKVADLGSNDRVSSEPLYQNDDYMRLYEPIMATQINLEGETRSTEARPKKLGAVVIEISKVRLNNQKKRDLILSLLTTLLIFSVSMIVAVRAARGISRPILQMYRAICKIGRGELEETRYPSSHIYELHELSEGINDMRKQLLRDRDMLENQITAVKDGLRETKEEVAQAYVDKKKLNEDLALALSELQTIMEVNPDILYVFNTKFELIQWNSNFAKFFGLTDAQLFKRHVSKFIEKTERDASKNAGAQVFDQGSTSIELQLSRHDGVLIPYLCNGVVLRNLKGEAIGFTGTGRDISDRKAAAQHIQYLAHYDMLTGLPNRTLLSDRLQQSINVCKREIRPLAIMFLDLDMFKYINDQYGHDMGDLLLKEAAIRIQKCLRETDTAARVGGDEFVVLLPSIDSEKMAFKVAEKIRIALELPFEIAGQSLDISASIGISIYPDHGHEEKVLLKNADTAMYLAKQRGRNTAIFFNS
jgi:diguanylate cyclase (GGDEF)-like protein/PAS domain S-box-containing protein